LLLFLFAPGIEDAVHKQASSSVTRHMSSSSSFSNEMDNMENRKLSFMKGVRLQRASSEATSNHNSPSLGPQSRSLSTEIMPPLGLQPQPELIISVSFEERKSI
jgi:hypothetical protein